MNLRPSVYSYLYTLIGALILMGVAIFNGFPLIYSDTGTYLASGFELETPFDRPINYGIFLRISSLNGLSLWLSALGQCLMLSYLILLTFRDFSEINKYKPTAILTCSLLVISSGVSCVSTQIITDVFPAISILAIWHLLFNQNLGKVERVGLYGLFFLANATHFSHLLFHSLLLIVLFLLRNQLSILPDKKRYLKNLALLMALTWLAILTMGSSLSKSKHNFYMARMAESGLLQDYLEEACPEIDYRLCEYKSDIPRDANLFLWDAQSPLKSYGSWKGSKEEFNQIILATFSQPKYLFRHIWEALKASSTQLLHFEVGDGNIPFVENSHIYERIQKYLPADSYAYAHSRQSRGLMAQDALPGINLWFKAVMVISVLGLIGFFIIPGLRRLGSIEIRILALYFLGVYVLNAAINASLVTLADRFAAKLAWLIPLALVLLLLNGWVRRNKD